MNEGAPNVRQRSSNIRATPCASFDGNGYPNRNFDALSTTSNKYSLPASDVFGILCRVHLQHLPWLQESGRQHGYIRWLRYRVLPLPPHDNTRLPAYPYTFLPGRWNLSRSSDSVRATPARPCWQRSNPLSTADHFFGTSYLKSV